MWHRHKPDPDTATQARLRAERDLELRRHDTHRIRALTDEWRRIRERNNIREALEANWKGGRT